MEEWKEAGDILVSFVTALNTFDWKTVDLLCSALIRRLDRAQNPFPEAIAKQLLSGLRRKRQFSVMEQLADALIRGGQRHPQIYRQYAQSMIDQGRLTGASLILNALLNDPKLSSDEQAEANGLLGRISKQLYVNAGSPSDARQQANLAKAIQQYYDVYRANPGKFYWHGINVVALLNRAARDGVSCSNALAAPEISRELASVLDSDELNQWQRATAIELAIATGDTQAAVQHTLLFVGDLGVDEFEVASLHRQLTEVWMLSAGNELGRTVLPLLQAALLRRAGGALEVNVAGTFQTAQQTKTAQHDLQRVFGQDRYEPLDWLRTALTRCSAVGRVESLTGQKIGTGFLVHGRDFFPSRPEHELLLLTNSHVISPANDLYDGAIPPNAARVQFEESGKSVGVGDLVWSSPPGALDASFVTLNGLEGQPEKCPLIPDPAPFDRARTQRLYVIGYPLGGGLSFSLQDSVWLDRDDKVLHYRTPTEPGSSGSPVFDQDLWTVVGLHHRGKKEMPRLNGEPGTYEANEAISLAAIQRETRKSDQPS